MPRFFFDTDDTIQVVSDDQGSELPDVDAVKRYACQAISEIMVDVARHTDSAFCRAVVRDEAGTHVLTARLTLETDTIAHE